MVHHKGIAIKFLPLLFVLVLVCMEYDFHFVSGEIRCLDSEREALLRFKKGLIDDFDALSSWGSEAKQKECCKWKGVECSNTTHHVTGLQLGGGFGGNISSALLDLRYLNHLDLSDNDFGGKRIPEFIGSMTRLEHLNLMMSNFSGTIPSQLGNLTSLRTLDLSYNSLRSDNLNWLSRLSLLSRLDFGRSNISDTNWLHHVLKLHSLQELHLRQCMLPDATVSASLFINSSSASLSVIDLSNNMLTSSTFDQLFNINTSVVRLDVSDNQLDGPIPDAFENFSSLEFLSLSNNALVGGLPKSLGNLSHLRTLYLFHNDLGGSFENLSCTAMVSLENADLSNNQFTGSVSYLSECSQLTDLDLSSNNLTESVPKSFGQLSKLESLDLSFNSLEGTIFEANFMKLHSLKSLDLSFNSLTLDMSPDWVPSFHLEKINLARCKMGSSFPKWLQTQINFTYLDISAAGISDEVPKWLWNLSPSVNYLNLSHNQISGTIPDFSSMNFVQIIDVSSNEFSGPIPLLHPQTTVFQLSKNMFSGPISSICTISSSMLWLLDLSNNQLVETIPNCWENMTWLTLLNLNNNHFSGEIPRSFGSLKGLVSLHLRGNNLSGELPSTLKNCQRLQLIDIGGNKLTGNIPSWFGENYPNMTYMSLRQNMFYGGIPPEICYFTQIQMLDLSENNISGNIPQCFNNFTSLADKNVTRTSSIGILLGVQITVNDYIDYALVQWKGQESEYSKTLGLLKLIDLSSNRLVGDIPRAFSSLMGLISLNLSRNSLTGSLDPNIGQMEMLEILDLSRNHLSGEIPDGLAQLHYLAILDLSNNNLSGKIPLSTQLQSFNASVYAANNKLCGLPLELCPGDRPAPPVSKQGEDPNDKDGGFFSMPFLQGPWIPIILGFIVGFWGAVGSLVLKQSWRTAYFNFWDGIGDWLYVRTIIFLRKLKRN